MATNRVVSELPAANAAPNAQVHGALLAGAAPRRPSRFLLRFFDLYLSLYVPFHFRALRLAHAERFPLTARPLIVVINHPSWWDPLTSILLSRFFLRQADHYAPIDALSLPRNRILAGLGLFPVEQGTPRGAVQFLRASQHILAHANSVLWLTPQGGFTDARARPVLFKSGLASLLKRLHHVTVVPLAYEYTWWDESKPEMLANCGEPLYLEAGARGSSARVEAALAGTQDELAALAMTRDSALFQAVLGGHTDVRGLRAAARNVREALHSRRPQSRAPQGVGAAAAAAADRKP